MHIIPDHLANHQLAAALERGATRVDRPVQAALAILLRIRGVLDRADVVEHIVQASDLTDPAALAAVRWDALARYVAAGLVPMAPPDRAAVLIARDLAGRIGDRLDVLDPAMAAVVVAAVGHAVGQTPEITRLRAELADAQAELRALHARLGTGDVRPASGDGREAVPAGIDGRPVGDRCLRCGRLRYVASPPPYPCHCDAASEQRDGGLR